MKVNQIIEKLEILSPRRFACSWDNVGLHVGDPTYEVKKVLITLDINDETVQKAIDENFDMIISHHPLIFHGVNKVSTEDYVGRRVLKLAENHICAYCMHTNFDCVGGMGQIAAEKIELYESETLEEVTDGEGIGKIGYLMGDKTVKELIDIVKSRFNVDTVVLYGDENALVSKAAIIPGSGKDDIDLAIKKGANAIITGDVPYHYGLDAMAQGISVIDAGHYGIEHIFIEFVGDYLRNIFDDLEVVEMPLNNPQKYI